MKIRERLSLQFTILVCGLLIISALILYFFAHESAERYFDNILVKRANTTFSIWNTVVNRDSAAMLKLDGSRKNQLPGERTIIMSSDGKILYNSNDSIVFENLSSRISEIEKYSRSAFYFLDYRVLGLRMSGEEGGIHYVFSSARPEDNVIWLQQLRFLMVGIFAIMVAIIALTGWFFSSRALHPIKKIIKDVQSIPITDIKGRLSGENNKDELGELIRILNDLLNRIENSVYLQKTFVANVSHELKNPITKIISQVEVTLLRERDSEVYRNTLKSILDDIREMNLLTQSLLDLSMVRHDPSSYNFMPVRIDEILWEVRDRIQSMPQGYRVDFAILSVPEDENQLIVSGNPYLLRTSFINLIENAGKYSDDKFIDVVMSCSAGNIEVIISNHGPGIPADKLPTIFDFGMRAQYVKTTTGFGIGLPLTQRILKIHNASIRIESDPGILTKVFVKFQF